MRDLDMRMNQNADRTARQVVNTYPETELHKILGMYGEVTNAKTLGGFAGSRRTNKPIQTVNDLKAVLQRHAPRGKENK